MSGGAANSSRVVCQGNDGYCKRGKPRPELTWVPENNENKSLDSTDRNICVAIDAIIEEDLVDLFVTFLYMAPVTQASDIWKWKKQSVHEFLRTSGIIGGYI